MNRRGAGDDETLRIDLTAAEWLVKQDRGLTAAEQDEYLQWLAADPRHGEWIARHRESWRDLDDLTHWRPAHSATPNPDLLRPRPTARGRAIRPSLRWLWPVAAALALSAGSLWWMGQGHEGADLTVKADAYERRELEDGSVLELNSGSLAEVRFSRNERRVQLIRGEGHFTVARNPERPFVVAAGGVAVKAVGTAFNVRLQRETVEVVVTEGKVQVSPPVDSAPSAARPGDSAPRTESVSREAVATSSPPLVAAGQRARVARLAAGVPEVEIASVTADDLNRLLGWQPQLLEFTKVPLGRVLEEFNRRNRIQLVLADAEFANVPIVASFRSDNVDGFIRLLEVTLDLRAEQRGANEIVLRTK